MTYEAPTILGLDVSRCRTCVDGWHGYNTDAYDYIELCHVLILLLVSVSVSVLH